MGLVGKLVDISDVTSWVSYVGPQPNNRCLNCKLIARDRDPLWQESRGFGKMQMEQSFDWLLGNDRNLDNFKY